MQQQWRALALLLALLALGPVPVVGASSQALRVARAWLRVHAGAPPQADELSELKGANPEAYAIVKALLTKRSLGLLDPKHPTASFVKSNAPVQDDTAEKGPEVFAKFAAPGEIHAAAAPVQAAPVSVPYAEVSAGGGHRDWMNWKPQESAMDDDAMVKNVLGAVAELKGKKAGLLSKRSSSSDDNPLTADAQSLGFDSSAQPAAQVSQPKAPVAAPVHENAYLKSIDFGIRAENAPVADAPAAPKKRENSYLKGIDLSGDLPAKAETSSSPKATLSSMGSSNYLASFSWDDAKPSRQEQQQEADAKLAAAVPKVGGKDSTLLSWLGVVKKAPVQAAPAQPAKPSNPYLADLSS